MISLNEGNKEIAAVLCKNRLSGIWKLHCKNIVKLFDTWFNPWPDPWFKILFSLFPSVYPRPEVEVLRMNPPLVNPRNDLSVQEADLMMNRNLEGTISMLESRGYASDSQMQILIQKQITKTILKMFLGAIQEDADDRGYEICQLLETPQQVTPFKLSVLINSFPVQKFYHDIYHSKMETRPSFL